MSIAGATAWNGLESVTVVPPGSTAATVTVSACAASPARMVSAPVQVNETPGCHVAVAGVANVAAQDTMPAASAAPVLPSGNTHDRPASLAPEPVTSVTVTLVSAALPVLV